MRQKEWSAENILELTHMYKISELLFAAVHLDLFTFLQEEKTVEVLSREMGCNQDALAVMLRVFVQIGLISVNDGNYTVNSSVKSFLSSTSTTSLVNMIELERVTRNKSIMNENLIARLHGDPFHRNKIDFPDTEVYMEAMTEGGQYSAMLLARTVTKRIDRTCPLRMLDLGCGPGTFTLSFLKFSSNISAVLVDRKEVLEVAKQRFQEAGFIERIELKAKDFMNEEIEGIYDFILLSNVCHFYSKTDIEVLLNRLRKNLTPFGKVIIHDFFIKPDSLPSVLMSLDWLANHAIRFNDDLEGAQEWLETIGWLVEDKQALLGVPTSYLVLRPKS